MVKKGLKLALLTLLAYLLQSTVAVHISIGDVAPNLALMLIAIVSVAYARVYTFVMALAVGYLMEIMLPALDYMNLILYPVCAMLGTLAFADKTERKLEEERGLGKRGGNWPAHLRTPLSALLSIAVFETVNLIYIYLNGVTIEGAHIGRALIDIAYTTVLTAALQFPVRWWLGMYRIKKAR